METLAHTLERTLTLCAPRETAFAHFTDSARFASWWGAGSSIDGRPGGAVSIRYPNGVKASGRVVELESPALMVFTYGYDDPSKGIPPGGSRVTVTLDDVPAGTRLHVRHDFAEAAARDAHGAGWRFQLSLFANVVTREAHADVGSVIGGFFTAWNSTDAEARQASLATTVVDDVTFRDPYAATSGRADLAAHIGALHLFMPGVTLEPAGEARQCQGTAICDWAMLAADGSRRGTGTNVFTLAADGRIAACVGFWTGS